MPYVIKNMSYIYEFIFCYRSAVQSCPEDEEDNIALSSEEKQKLLNAKQAQVRHLVGEYLILIIYYDLLFSSSSLRRHKIVYFIFVVLSVTLVPVI